MQSGMVPVQRGQLYFETCGDGEPIIFLHGFTFDHRMWQPQVDYFSKQYEVITYDMRGFGKSTLPTTAYSHHEDLCQLMSFLKIDAASIIGLSLGGEMATDFTLSYPQMVRKLILADASMHGFDSTVDWQVHAQTVGLIEAKNRWLNHQVFKTTAIPNKMHNELKTMVADYSGWHWFNHDPREKLSPPAIDRLAEITCPTLIITGSQDLSYFQTIADKYHQDIVGSQKISIPEAGHMINMEKPEQFNTIIEQFIK